MSVPVQKVVQSQGFFGRYLTTVTVNVPKDLITMDEVEVTKIVMRFFPDNWIIAQLPECGIGFKNHGFGDVWELGLFGQNDASGEQPNTIKLLEHQKDLATLLAHARDSAWELCEQSVHQGLNPNGLTCGWFIDNCERRHQDWERAHITLSV